MNLNLPSAQNWSRAFTVWISGIEVQFQPVQEVRNITGGLLRQVRRVTRFAAPLLTLFFSLHCTRPELDQPRAAKEGIGLGTGVGEIFTESGQASWYGGDGDGFAGRQTASGEVMDPEAMTCAHRTLPLGSFVEVENTENGRRGIFRVNDRGPFSRGRVLDVSRRGAQQLGFIGKGTTSVRLRSVSADGRPVALDPSANAQNPYVVQVAALSDPINVERLTRELGEHFGPVSLQDATLKGGRAIKRVRVGSFTQLSEAERVADELARRFKDRGIDPFITRRR